MRPKLKDPSGEKGPGPDYKPIDIDVYKTRAPRYQMGIRTKELSRDKFPAPNAYDSSEGKAKVMIKRPAYSMGVKTAALTKDKFPSPAEYDVKQHNPFDKMPAFSFGTKHSEYAHVPIVPLDNC